MPPHVRSHASALQVGLFFLIASTGLASSQEVPFPELVADNEQALVTAMPALARAVLDQYHDSDRETHLRNLFQLQAAAGQYADASNALHELHEVRRERALTQSFDRSIGAQLYVQAKGIERTLHRPFNESFKEAFRERFAELHDSAALDEGWMLGTSPVALRNILWGTLDRLRAKKRISVSEAVALIQAYVGLRAHEEFADVVGPLLEEDDARRYAIQPDALIRTQDGATVSAVVVRKKAWDTPHPSALLFTIYTVPTTNLHQAKLAAVHGYAGVVADTRGKRLSPGPVEPFVHEAADAYSVIDWISKQPWSDGRVAMYGGSYGGFAQWAAVKHVHPALKTIVPYVANNPGLGLPMENNIFLYANYAWNFYVADNNTLDEAIYSDTSRWRMLNQRWYASGRPYRDIDSLDGRPNRILQEQLGHPAYDRYWQAMTPYKEEFAKITIPILSITGYFEDNLPTVEYLTEHYRYAPRTEHYLVVGPYDHFGAQSEVKPGVVGGYPIDPAAQFDTSNLTFQWLDYVMGRGPKPTLLQDRVNYEVMGADTWKHAPSIEQMSRDSLTLYLTSEKVGERYRLSEQRPALGVLEQSIDFSDRTTSNNLYPSGVVVSGLDGAGTLSFISEPIDDVITIAGRVTGEIEAIIDKRDMDFTLALYEVMPDGRYLNLSYYLGRASYAHDMTSRALLTPGKRASIPFWRTPLIGRQLSKGSRLLLLLTVAKNAYAQINYGTGKDVSDESIADAITPLHVRWLTDSFIKVPVDRRPPGRGRAPR
ncbi:MAG TPA: CocE/NonD family hydrolase [Steroidobacteraceae bacterium]|nr:CocE/NonD family hydrolase [Steroidobacteraceae bacterium]